MKHFKPSPPAFYALMILAMTLWGGSWVSAKILALDSDPVAITFWRFIGVSLSALLLARLLEGRTALRLTSRRTLAWILAGGLFLALYNLVFFWGLRSFPSGKAGILVTTTNPLFAFGLGWLFGAERISPLRTFALLLGLVGGLLQLNFFAELQMESLVFLGSALLWALLTLSTRKAQLGIGLFGYTTWVYAVSLPLILVWALINGVALFDASMQASFWLNVVYLAIPAGVFATAMYFYATRTLGTGVGGSFSLMVPVTAMLWSALVFAENPAWYTIVGGLISLVALALIQSTKIARRPR